MKLLEITEYKDPNLDLFARDSENLLAHYYEPHGGLFIAESPRVIERAMNAGYEPVVMLIEQGEYELPQTDAVAGEIPANANDSDRIVMARCLAGCGDIPVYTAPLTVLEKITGYKLTRGALCAMKRKALPALQELLELPDIRRIAVIDNVENPTNVGAIFRSAAAMGMDAVLLTADSSDPLYRRAIRVSMGSVFHIPWTVIGREEYAQLKAAGFRLAAMALKEDSVSIDDAALMAEEKLAVLMGNEGEGLSEETIAGCDYTVMIPMHHGVDSLNVAAASAVAFWQLGNNIHRMEIV